MGSRPLEHAQVILSRLLYLAIGRRRGCLADASAVELTRYPEGLASALEKISGDKEDMPIPLTHLAATHSLPVRDRRHCLKLGSGFHDLMVFLCGLLKGPVKGSTGFQSRLGS